MGILNYKSVLLSLTVHSEEYPCFFPIDMMILQDTTGSFVEDLPNVAREIPVIVDRVLKQNPGSKFGAAEFKDKPYRDLGEPTDFCYKLAQNLTSSAKDFQDQYSVLYASGGGDLPEASLQALINVAQDPTVGWRLVVQDTEHNNEEMETGARVIVVSTDAVPQEPEGYNNWNGVWFPDDEQPAEPRPPKYMTPFPDNSSNVSVDEQCKHYAYPSMAQAAKVLKEAKFNVLFLIPQNETAAIEQWSEFNTRWLNQPAKYLQYIKPDSSDIVEVILHALGHLTETICYSRTTSTTVAKTSVTDSKESTVTQVSTPPSRPAKTTINASTTSDTTTTSTLAVTSTTQPTTLISTLAPSSATSSTAETSTPSVSSPDSNMSTLSNMVSECTCVTGMVDCECMPALLVRVNQKPKLLDIQYEA